MKDVQAGLDTPESVNTQEKSQSAQALCSSIEMVWMQCSKRGLAVGRGIALNQTRSEDEWSSDLENKRAHCSGTHPTICLIWQPNFGKSLVYVECYMCCFGSMYRKSWWIWKSNDRPERDSVDCEKEYILTWESIVRRYTTSRTPEIEHF